MNTVKENLRLIFQSIVIFLKWVLIAGVVGAVGGLVGSAFHLSVEVATHFREQQPWLLYLLPVSGLAIVWLYHALKMNRVNTNAIIDSIHDGSRVPLALVPAIYLSTVITHLFGGSAGREGAALQLGGCIGSAIGRSVKLGEKDMHLAVMCGMSGLFSALFGTPLTATIFAMEVISVGIIYYSAFLPCIVSALTAYGITLLFGLTPTAYPLTDIPELSVVTILLVAVIGLAAALVSMAFCITLEQIHKFAAKTFKNEYLRVIVGGAVIALLTLILGTRYNGIGGSVITAAVKGGEIIPTFFIGSTMGALIGSLIGLPPGFAAAIGLVALFCGVVNCPIASLVLSVELFGSSGLLYFAVAVCLSYMLSGYYGLYSGQKIMYSKRRARYINRNAK